MAPQPAVILVEDSPYESALAYVALTRETSSVVQVADLREAARLASGGGGLAILGQRAIKQASNRQLRALGIPAVGGVRLSNEDRRRAFAAGVSAVYNRPRSWNAYLALIASVLQRQIRAGVMYLVAIRKDSPRRPDPTR